MVTLFYREYADGTFRVWQEGAESKVLDPSEMGELMAQIGALSASRMFRKVGVGVVLVRAREDV